MFSKFFIDRPIFATVVSLVFVLAGLVSMKVLPIEQYPNIVPTEIQISATYPGATAEVLADTVAAPILAMNGMQWNALDEEQQKLRYQVPYVIWANYDIDEEQNADTSANYLGAEVLKRAGVPTDAYQNFLLTLKESYPVISAVRTVEADGSETPAKEEYGEMDIYRKLQYYFMFDWEEESGE